MIVDIFNDYLARFPDSISVEAVDQNNTVVMDNLLNLMADALKTGIPLNDDIFDVPDNALI